MIISAWLPLLKFRKKSRRAHRLQRNIPVMGVVEQLEDRTLLTSFFGLETGFLKEIYDHISTVDRNNETTGEETTHQDLVQKGHEVTGYSSSQVNKTLNKLEKYYAKIEARYGDELRSLFGTLDDDDNSNDDGGNSNDGDNGTGNDDSGNDDGGNDDSGNDDSGNGSDDSSSNTAPAVTSIADQTLVARTSFNLDVGTSFSDQDAGDELTYSVKWNGGDSLPGWISFDAQTGLFSGTPGEGDTGTFSVEVTATDNGQASVSATFSLAVNPAPNVLVSDASFNESNAPDNAVFTVSLDAESSETITVTVKTVGGTATENTDYTATTTQVTFAPGTTEQTVAVPILADGIAEPTETFTLVVESVDAGTVNNLDDTGTGTINDDDPVSLGLDLSQNQAVQSNGTLVTRQDEFVISGNTQPGATVEVARDADGQFNDGSVTADSQGNFQFTVDLVHTNANQGAHSIQVRSTFAGQSSTEQVNVHYATGTVVRMESSAGSFDVELFDTEAPQTVANFKTYFSDFTDSVIHRSVSSFIIQGGGFNFDTTTQGLVSVPTNSPVENEFISKNSNIRGTLSTALLSGNVDSFTSGWFINTVDNTFLDNVPHTVFGRVIGTGMDVVDAIGQTPVFNLNGVYDGTAFATVPLINYTPFGSEIDGLVSIAPGSDRLTGVSTQFVSQLQSSFGSIPGSAIRIGDEEFVVRSITDNNELVLNRVHTTGETNVKARVHSKPLKENLVLFSSVSVLFNLDDTI